MRTMFGVLCVYLLIGMAFALRATGSIAAIESERVLRPDRSRGDQSDYLYFSFATMTTTGFGDLTAAERPRPLAGDHRGADRPDLPGHGGRPDRRATGPLRPPLGVGVSEPLARPATRAEAVRRRRLALAGDRLARRGRGGDRRRAVGDDDRRRPAARCIGARRCPATVAARPARLAGQMLIVADGGRRATRGPAPSSPRAARSAAWSFPAARAPTRRRCGHEVAKLRRAAARGRRAGAAGGDRPGGRRGQAAARGCPPTRPPPELGVARPDAAGAEGRATGRALARARDRRRPRAGPRRRRPTAPSSRRERSPPIRSGSATPGRCLRRAGSRTRASRRPRSTSRASGARSPTPTSRPSTVDGDARRAAHRPGAVPGRDRRRRRPGHGLQRDLPGLRRRARRPRSRPR